MQHTTPQNLTHYYPPLWPTAEKQKTAKIETKMKKIILPILAALLCASCVVYHPHNTDIPLLREQGDLHVDGSFSMSAPLLAAPAVNATVAYAPLNMVGVQASASFTNPGIYHFQGAAGTYFPFGLSVLECYVGYAYGSTRQDTVSNLVNNVYRTEGHYTLVFSQLNFGWAGLDDDCIDLGFGLKCGLMTPQFDKIQVASDGTETLVVRHDAPTFVFQPQLMFRFGWPKFKFCFNVAYAALSGWPTDDNYFNYDRFSAGFGVHYKF